MNYEKFNTSTSIKNVQLENSVLNTKNTVDNMNTCSCGCNFEIGSPEFIRLHVESQEEQEQREALEQYNAEQNAQAEYYANMPEPHSMCGCVECN